ncbi:MAG: alpha-L-arabinofuranosidase, partial [Acidobacteriota bacterium]|nr:alpha-L-arabinofuranosidase [Acidobacteriota bacterium]
MKLSLTQKNFSSRVVALICAFALFASQTQWVAAQQASAITVQVDKPGARIPATLFGLFFEDINFGADGGLYPERVKNRSFEFPDPLMGWKQIDGASSKGTLYVLDQGSVKNVPNSHYLRLKVAAAGNGFGITNEGFRGIGVEKGAEYTFSINARRVGEGTVAGLRVELQDAEGK